MEEANVGIIPGHDAGSSTYSHAVCSIRDLLGPFLRKASILGLCIHLQLLPFVYSDSMSWVHKSEDVSEDSPFLKLPVPFSIDQLAIRTRCVQHTGCRHNPYYVVT